MRKKGNPGLVIAAVITVLAMLYVTAVFSDIPFVKKYRELYIETAMSTFSHKWLATGFIPKPVIDDVMSRAQQQIDSTVVDESAPPPADDEKKPEEKQETITEDELPQEETPTEEPDYERIRFLSLFDEIDETTFPQDIESGELGTLQLSAIIDRGILTKAGDPVWAIDAVNGILIAEVSGESFKGKIAIIKDPSAVFLGTSRLDSRGETLGEFCKDHNAVLAINANGFVDPEGKGKGDTAVGLIISGGEKINPASDEYGYQIGGFDFEDNFLVGSRLKSSSLRDAAQFMPAVIIEGKDNVNGSMGLGIQPRTVIGQTAEKEVLMLVIDGRQIGHSLGCTVTDCAKIMLHYGCWNALCMDGGSSSAMYYDGAIITKPSTPMVGGRYLPDAWLVKRSDG